MLLCVRGYEGIYTWHLLETTAELPLEVMGYLHLTDGGDDSPRSYSFTEKNRSRGNSKHQIISDQKVWTMLID